MGLTQSRSQSFNINSDVDTFTWETTDSLPYDASGLIKLYTSAGYIYGNFSKGKLVNCQAIVKYFNGDIYRGDILMISSCMQPHGIGTMEYTDGTVYRGQFTQRQVTGRGVMIGSTGVVYEGMFDSGVIVAGKVTHPNGAVVEGKFKDKCLIEGKFTREDGVIYEGPFVNNKLNGHGTITHPDGTVQKGLFADDLLIADGDVCDADEYKGNGDDTSSMHDTSDMSE